MHRAAADLFPFQLVTLCAPEPATEQGCWPRHALGTGLRFVWTLPTVPFDFAHTAKLPVADYLASELVWQSQAYFFAYFLFDKGEYRGYNHPRLKEDDACLMFKRFTN